MSEAPSLREEFEDRRPPVAPTPANDAGPPEVPPRGAEVRRRRLDWAAVRRRASRLVWGNLLYIAPAAMLLLAFLLRVEDPQFIEVLRLKVFDLYQHAQPREWRPAVREDLGIKGVKIIDVDDASLAEIGQWPWPRNRLAEMLVRVFEAGGSVVAFDSVFAEPDRTSPKEVLPVWLGQPSLKLEELPPEWRQFSEGIMQSLPDHDAAFADVIGQTNIVAGFALTPELGGREPAVKAGFSFAGDDPLPFVLNFRGAVPNLAEIEQAAAGVGSFNMAPEADNIVRRIPLLMRLDDQLYPSLALEALRLAQGAKGYIVKSSGANMEESYGEKSGLNHIKVGHLVLPVDANGRFWVHFARTRCADATAQRSSWCAPSERMVSARTLFAPDFDPKTVEGMVLFLGTSAAGLKDLRATPLDPAAAGVTLHAEIAEQALLGDFLSRPDWANGAEILFMILLGGVLIVLTPKFGALAGAATAIGAVAAALSLSWLLYKEQNLLIDPVYPSLAIVFVYLAGSLLSFLRTEAEKRSVRGAFGQYLSPALVEQLAREPDRLKLGGEMRNMTFLFSDVRGFTSISERFKTNPQGLTRLINRFLTPMTDMILSRQGTIDKYMGDCIMAFWNAPFDVPGHAEHACESALAMQVELTKLNAEFAAEAEAAGESPMKLAIGVGINTGDCVVGNMGSKQRFDYTVLGDAVNLASRLEGQSKNYGVIIVIGETTQAAAPRFAALELDLIAVKGKKEAARIFTLLGDETTRDSEEFQRLRDRHRQMIEAYRRQDWAAAERMAAECRGIRPQLEGLYDLYEERCQYYRETPPGPDWDGVFVATSK
jgi:adenylate cyclase